MGYYVDMKRERLIAIETRCESVRVYDRSIPPTETLGNHIFTWGPGGTTGCAAFEITYDALASLVCALAFNADARTAAGRAWEEALQRASAQYAPEGGAP